MTDQLLVNFQRELRRDDYRSSKYMTEIFFDRTYLEFIGEFEGDLQREVAQFLQQLLLLMTDTHHQRVLALLYPDRVLGKGEPVRQGTLPSLPW